MKNNEQGKHIQDFMRGFLRADAEDRELMMARTDWGVLAQLELDRRATRFLTLLPDELLSAVASGEVDIAKLARELQH